MHAYLRKSTKVVINFDVEEGEERNEDAPQPSSETKYKQAKKKTQASMASFLGSAPTKSATQKESMSSMLCKTPEEVVERHKLCRSRSTFENCTKKGKEAKQRVDDHVADFLYENRIPLHVVKSRS
jgi:hypothetical protein